MAKKSKKPTKKSERLEALMRILVGIVSGIILYFWAYVIYILAAINWLIALVAGFRHKGIAEFIEYWNTESYKFARYLSGMSNRRPFPFSDLERISRFEK